MRRIEMFELHDHPHFPAKLRDLVTDALEALWEFGNSYRPILGLLREGLTANGEENVDVLDLCSGGGGPWLRLARGLEAQLDGQIEIRLSDKYPNREAILRIDDRSQRDKPFKAPLAKRVTIRRSRVRMSFATGSVDALKVPPETPGFRTIFSSFHHFGPAEARSLLFNAVDSGRGIGIFELAQRGSKTMLVLCFTPFLVLFLTPFMRPFRWSRLLWTYIIPVVPFVIWFDGWASCLRTYSKFELEEMVEEVARRKSSLPYLWQTGEVRSGFLPVTYLIGYPTAHRQIDRTDESKPGSVTSDPLVESELERIEA